MSDPTPDEPDYEIPDELAEELGFEGTRREHMKRAALADEDGPEERTHSQDSRYFRLTTI